MDIRSLHIALALLILKFRLGQNRFRADCISSGIGYYEAFLNGCKIRDRVLEPGWTESTLYSVYDITDMLCARRIRLGLRLAEAGTVCAIPASICMGKQPDWNGTRV